MKKIRISDILNSSGVKPFLISVSGVAILAILATVIIMLISNAPESVDPLAIPLYSAQSEDYLMQTPSAEDFFYPEVGQTVQTFSWIPYRGQIFQWSDPMVNRFWLNPIDIGIDSLSELNDELILSLMEEIP